MAATRRFDQLVALLRDELDWPIGSSDFEDLTFEYDAEELGIDKKNAAKIEEIKRLRPLVADQPWGIYFVKFEPKRLPVVALRRILSAVAGKKRPSANSAERPAWAPDDLLFVSNYGEGEERQISFAHFSRSHDGHDLPRLNVLGWNNRDTALHLDAVARELSEHLTWPDDASNTDEWRARWRAAFTLGHREVVTTSKRLAVKLAKLSDELRRRIKAVLDVETENGRVTRLMVAFRAALMADLDADDFADMYAQTIAYGLLSARIVDPLRTTVDGLTTHMRTNPLLQELMESFLAAAKEQSPSGLKVDFDELGVSEVIDLLDQANMEAIVRDFGDRNPQEDPVIHFYELFLSEYDKAKKVMRGVFYTPRPVVSFIVRSVDALLQTKFGLEDGLADTSTWADVATLHPGIHVPDGVSPDDPFVKILDPATGTGTFLVETIDLIFQKLMKKWQFEGRSDAEITTAWNEYVAVHLLPRLYGFELLMAPYAIAHLRVALKLLETGYDFSHLERARVFLTNALEPSHNQVGQLALMAPALASEAEEVNEVKRTTPFTVVLGNPPYAGHSSNNEIHWIVDLVYDYKRGFPDLHKPAQAKWLQDDYVKFIRFAEWHLEKSGAGILGFITNHSWLENPTFKGMRSHLMAAFDELRVLDLHGNANRGGSRSRAARDENVFEIKQGVAVSVLLRAPGTTAGRRGAVWRGDLVGAAELKYEQLAAGVISTSTASDICVPLEPENVFAHQDEELIREYDQFFALPDVMGLNGDPAPGVLTTQDGFAVSFTKEEQEAKIEALLATKTEQEARALFPLCTTNQWRYEDAVESLRTGEWRKQLRPVLYRPFDLRWTVYDRYVAVHRRERVSGHLLRDGNIALLAARQGDADGAPQVFVAQGLAEAHAITSAVSITSVFPLWLEPDLLNPLPRPNLSPNAIAAVEASTQLAFSATPSIVPDDLAAEFGPRDLLHFLYAVLHSRTYRSRYAEILRARFPRVPLTPPQGLFRSLVEAGAKLVELHLLQAEGTDDLQIGFEGVAPVLVEQVRWYEGLVSIDRKRESFFTGISKDAWEFRVGGYQVCHKWLKDRIGKTLSEVELHRYQEIVTAVTGSLVLMEEIDASIARWGGWPSAFAEST